MNWKASPPAIEIAAVTIAVACLGGATGFAVARIVPLGAGLIEASGAAALVALGALLILHRVDRPRGMQRTYASESLNEVVLAHKLSLLDQLFDDRDTLLLTDALPASSDALLLDEPLPALSNESRVVRLFAPQPVTAAAPAPTLVGPGDMIARIEDFLGQARGSATPRAPERRAEQAPSDDASAALHAALADIRRSLRHG